MKKLHWKQYLTNYRNEYIAVSTKFAFRITSGERKNSNGRRYVSYTLTIREINDTEWKYTTIPDALTNGAPHSEYVLPGREFLGDVIYDYDNPENMLNEYERVLKLYGYLPILEKYQED